MTKYWKPSLLLVTIFLMAGIYNILWIARPDYFRIQQDVNFLPLDLVQAVRGDKSMLPLVNTSDGSAVKAIQDIYAQFLMAANAASEAQKAADDLGVRVNAGEKAFQDSQWSQFEQYVQGETKSHRAALVQKDEEIRTLLESYGVTSVDNLAVGEPTARFYQLAIDRAKLAQQLAQTEYNARNYAMHNLTSFQTTIEQQEHVRLIHQERDAQQAVFKTKDDLSNFAELHTVPL